MNNYLRDTVFGQVIRLISRKAVLKYPDERDPSLWKVFIRKEELVSSVTMIQSEFMANPESLEAGNMVEGEEERKQSRDIPSEVSLESDHDLNRKNKTQEKKVAVTLVDWYSQDDPEV